MYYISCKNPGISYKFAMSKINKDFEKDLFELIKSSHGDIIEAINSSGNLEDDVASKLSTIIEEFKKNR